MLTRWQFQITVNITAVLLAFVSAVSDAEMRSVLTAVQLLWVNLIMDTFAALALATDPPTEAILDRPPQPKRAPLITTNMWKMIIGQSIFQLAVTFVLYFAGGRIFPSYSESELRTIVFNTFVWMQIFNEFNNRRLDNKFNIFEGLHRNQFFIVINILMVGLQVVIIFVGGQAFSIVRINGPQWAVSLVLAFLSLPWAIVIRLFPDPLFAKIARIVGQPVVFLYRLLCRTCSRVGRVFKRSSKTADEESSPEDGLETAQSSKSASNGGKELTESPVMVITPAEEPQRLQPEIMIEDTEPKNVPSVEKSEKGY